MNAHSYRFALARPTLAAYDGDAPAAPPDLTAPEVQAAIQAAVGEATAGLKANHDALLAEKKTLQVTQEEFAKRFEGIDPEQFRAVMATLENNEEAKLLAEGKVEDVIDRRTERLRKQAEADVASAQKVAADLQEKMARAEGVISSLIIDGRVRDACSTVDGFVSGAIADATMRGRMTFTLDDDLRPVAKAADGTILRGANGRDPLTPEEWVAGLTKSDCRHWLAPSNGGGAGGGKGGEGPEKTTREKLDEMSPLEMLEGPLREQSAQRS